MPNRVLKRPMFRRGGMANQGIMSGLVDRTGYQEGGNIQEDSRNFFQKNFCCLRLHHHHFHNLFDQQDLT